MILRDIMKSSPKTVVETTRLGEAHRLMTEHAIRHLPVMRDGRLCGIVSAADILLYRASTAFREDWWRAPVSAAMTFSPQTAGPDDSLREVAGRLARSRIDALPVVEGDALVGIVTVIDLLAAEARDAMA